MSKVYGRQHSWDCAEIANLAQCQKRCRLYMKTCPVLSLPKSWESETISKSDRPRILPLTAHSPHTDRVKTELLFAITTTDETMIGIDTIVHGNYKDPKAHGHCCIKCGSKHKNKGISAKRGTKHSFLSFPYILRR